jgi:hypothetical protein
LPVSAATVERDVALAFLFEGAQGLEVVLSLVESPSRLEIPQVEDVMDLLFLGWALSINASVFATTSGASR